MTTFNGMLIYQTNHAVQPMLRFPDKPLTKRRKRRVIGKYGSLYVTVPCSYVFNNKLFAHPKVVAALQAQTF